MEQSRKRTKIKPLVLASFVAAKDMYLVVGVIGAPRVGDTSLLHKYARQSQLKKPPTAVAPALVVVI